jgi:hypothetical protein
LEAVTHLKRLKPCKRETYLSCSADPISAPK